MNKKLNGISKGVTIFWKTWNKSSFLSCCKQNSWIEFDRGYYCQKREFIVNKQKCQIDKKST